MSTGAAAWTNIGVNTVMGAGQYSTTQLVNGQSPTAGGLIFSGVWGGLTSAFGEIIAPVGKPSKYWIENFTKDAIRNTGLNLEYNYITNRIPPAKPN